MSLCTIKMLPLMRKFFLFIITFFIYALIFAQGEQYAFSKIDIYNGLSHNQVNTILKGSDGFIWFGTMSGLNRYDGYSIKVYRNNIQDSFSLNDNYIENLYELPAGKMWVVTNIGPCIYDSKTEKFNRDYQQYLKSLSLPQGNVVKIIKGHKNLYWFVFDSLGLYQYDPVKRKAIHYQYRTNDPSSIATNRIANLRTDAHGNLWVIHQNGIIQMLDATSKKEVLVSDALQKANPGNFLYELFIDSDSDAWIWTEDNPRGIYLFQSKTNSIRHFNESGVGFKLNNNFITGVIEDKRGIIWVSTDHGGINLINKKRDFAIQYLVNDPRNAKSISQNSITTIYKDDLGIIWLGTYKQGINYLNERIIKFTHYHHQDAVSGSLQYDDVNRFVEDKKGNIWIGTNGGGLIYFDRTRNTFKQYVHDPSNRNSISNNVIVSLCIDHEDKLWIGTYFGGLSSFDGTHFIHYRHDDKDTGSLSDDRVWEIFEDSRHNLWVGTLSGGLNLLDRKSGKFIHYQNKVGLPSPLQSNYVCAFNEDRFGNLWIGTSIGLTVFEKNIDQSFSFHHYDQTNGLSNNNVISILQDSKGRIWVGTREGLDVFDPAKKTFRSFNVNDGLPDNAILTILEDNKQNLWITTPNGLCNLVFSNSASVGMLSFSVITYDEINNLQSREFNENAALKTRSGELIFGGPAGFNIIDPSKINRLPGDPKIVFTNLQILNNNIEVGEVVNNRTLLLEALPVIEKINLKYKENVFSIEFAALDFSHGTKAKYAYKLEGFNNEWLFTDGSQPKATYTNLDPGSYMLKVKVLNSNGEWSKEKALNILIAPPFWRTPLAYFIYIAFLAGILFLARQITVDRAHMRFEVQQQRKESERMHALDMMKTKFFTNVSHEFRTPLSLIISPLDKIIKNTSDPEQKKQLHLVHRNAKRLLNLVNQLLDFRKMEVQEFRLHPVAGDIIKFIKDISFTFSDISEKKNIAFSFQSNVTALETYFDKDKLEKILFNLLSNAFKYTYDHGQVSVKLEYTPDEEKEHSLSIHVCDTGIGIPKDKQERIFDRFFQNDVPDSMVNQGSGIGLSITKEFVKLHNGTINVSSEPDKGSCFTVILPARKISDSVNQSTVFENIIPTETIAETENEREKNRKKTILLVEDNEDFRFYLKDNLKAFYNVEEAANGKEGLEKVKSLSPELVVSDIMMPLMNGIELAQKIKSDTLTAHIPVILLTAVGNEEIQLEGYEIGINDYITKPFTFEILASRIKNLLAQQKLLKKNFQKQLDINPSDITITPLDELFMKQALASVEKNIGNPDYSVEDLSRDMHMSRVALYKKILALTGKAPLEFIRTIRLKRGAQLLERSGKSIAEIAYEVGFNNPKNFSRYFKEEFKVLPSQYVTQKE